MQRHAYLLSLLVVVAAVGPAAGGIAAASLADTSADTHVASDSGVSHPAASDRRPAVRNAQSDACPFPYTATDATGTEVTIDADPERIVTLNPSAAQTMWEIGARDEVVGVSQYASYLDGADEKANVSGPSGPSVERVIDANPDLVLVPSSSYGAAEERTQQLRDQGIPVFVFGQGTSLEFVANKTESTGRLTGNCEAGTERAAEMRQSIALMEQSLDDEEPPVGLNVFFGYTSGSNTFIGDVMETAGVRNGAAEADVSGFRQINDEQVVEMNPEWIVVPANSPVPATPAYNSTTAVQEGNVVVVNTSYLQQPAPRAVIAAETIMRAVHPEAYDEYRERQAGAEREPTATTGSTPTTAPPETAAATATPTPGSPSTTATGTPGFGPVVSVAAVAALAVLAARRR